MRDSEFIREPNCSIAQIENNEVVVFHRPLYLIQGTEICYSEGHVLFFYKEQDLNSLNQAHDHKPEKIYFPLNMAFEILRAFREINNATKQDLHDMQEQ